MMDERSKKIIQWIDTQKQPFDRKDAIHACNVSYADVAKALGYMEGLLMHYERHVGNGNFRTNFFPIGWTVDDCISYMNRQTKTGRSKAKLYLLGKGKVQ